MRNFCVTNCVTFAFRQKDYLEPNALKDIQMLAIDVSRLNRSCIAIILKSLAPLEGYRLSCIGKIDIGNKTIFKNAEVV